MPLHVHRFGPADGRPLVALHGLKGHGRRWQTLADHYLPDLRVYAPDLRGHGASMTEPPWTLEQHAHDVLTVLDHAGLDRVPVIGHSLGGTIAVYLARLAPERVDRIILLDPGIALPPHVAETRARDALHAPVFDSPGQAAQERARFWPTQAHALVDDEVAHHLVQGQDGRWRWRYSVPAAVASYSELARPALTPPPHTPTLLIVAGRYQAVHPGYPDACRAVLADLFTYLELDCGHHIHLERPEETARLTHTFLRQPQHRPELSRHRSINHMNPKP